MAIISKGELMLALGDDLDTLTGFLFSGSPEGTALKWQLEQAAGFDLDSPVVQKKFQSLVTAGIVQQATMDKLLAGNVQANVESSVLRKWDVSSIAGDWNKWVTDNIEPKGTAFSIAAVENTVITTGVLPVKEIV